MSPATIYDRADNGYPVTPDELSQWDRLISAVDFMRSLGLSVATAGGGVKVVQIVSEERKP